MAWIEVHQDLRWHWKIERLAVDLQIEKAHALGLITSLWLWAVGNARDGQVGRFTPRELCAACGWNGTDEARFVELLKQHELIDQDGRIHDWEKHGTRLLDQARHRVMKHRLDDGRPVTRNVTGNITRNANLGKKERKRVSKKESFNRTSKALLPTPEIPPRPLTADEQAVLAYLQHTSPINRLQDPERVMRRLFDAYSDVGSKWVLGELRKIVSYCAARGEWEGQRKDWAATIRNWLKRAYGDPAAREQIKALISKVGNIPSKQPAGATA